jgi:peptidyl-prolyl cis-trans isomerase D
MLQKMREKIQGIIATVIIVILCLAFGLWGVQYYLKGRGSSNFIAKVNGIKISRAQFQTAYDRAKQNIMAQTGGEFVLSQEQQQKLKQQVLQQIINNQIIAQQAAKLKLSIIPAQVSSVLASFTSFQVNGQFSAARFQEMLGRMLYSKSQFLNDLKQNMLVDQLQVGIAYSNFCLPNEVADAIKLVRQQRDISYAIIPLTKFKNIINISENDIQSYYQKNQLQFALPEKVSINYIELTAASMNSKVKYNEEDLQKYYDDNLASFSRPKSWQISAAFIPLARNAGSKEVKQAEQSITAMEHKAKSGVSLSKLDPEHANPVWVTSDQVVSSLAPVLASLKEGDISSPIKTPEGFYLIKLLKKRPAATMPYAKVKDQVRKSYIQQKTNQLFDEASQKLSDLSYTNSNSLNPAATELGLKIKSTDLFAAEGEKSGLLANQKVVKAAFSDNVLRQNYNSDLIEINPGDIIVLRVKEYQSQVIKSLTEVKSLIAARLYDEAAKQEAQKLGAKLLQELHQNKSLMQAAKEQGLFLKTLYKMGYSNKPKGDADIFQAALLLPMPMDNIPSYGGVALKDGSYAIIAVNKVYLGDPKQVGSKQISALTANMAEAFGQMDFNLFTNKYIKNAKIKKLE